MSADQRELSLRLNAILEMVGASEKMRKFHHRTATTLEILQMSIVKLNTGESGNIYICGSSYEGTTPDLLSDVDSIGCPNEPLVVPHRVMAGPGTFLRIIRDEWTRTGYVKLQLMRNGGSLTVYDIEARENVGFDKDGRACVKPINRENMHGPALMSVDHHERHYFDDVMAYKCKGIPLFATDWITRHRCHGWPSQQMIDELKMMGCLFVGVGYIGSPDKDIEWRLSFALQERMLMKSLNPTQHKIYILLKMVKKNIIEKDLGTESLSSYQFKTCLFHMVETTPASFWIPENLLKCLQQCITLLLTWIRERFCPSFFLREQNLFDKDGFQRLLAPLERLIDSLLQKGHHIIYLIQSDHVGEMMRDGNVMMYKDVSDLHLNKYIFDINFRVIRGVVTCCRGVLRTPDVENDTLASLLSELDGTRHTDALACYSEEEVRDALEYRLPWVHLSLSLEFAACAVTCLDRHEITKLTRRCDYHLQQAKNTDLVNVRLAQASLWLMLGKLQECLLLLEDLENSWSKAMITCCWCTLHRSHLVLFNEQHALWTFTSWKDMSVQDLMRNHLATCVIFERSQLELVPPPLCYEIFRSLGTLPSSRDALKDAWFDKAVIDATVYLYLMQYLVYSKLNRQNHKKNVIVNLAALVVYDVFRELHHQDTAYNILGWVYLQESREADAVRCFLKSWKIRPHHNAAKLHLLVHINFTRLQ